MRLFFLYPVENLHGIPFNRLYNVLQSCKELLYRDVDLLSSISDYVASTFDIWTNKQVLKEAFIFYSCFVEIWNIYQTYLVP